MSDSEARTSFIKDPRMPCKYGSKCFQKNPVHHEKYKHPPKKGARKPVENKNTNTNSPKHAMKKMKMEISDHKTKEDSDTSDGEQFHQDKNVDIKLTKSPEITAKQSTTKDSDTQVDKNEDKSIKKPKLTQVFTPKDLDPKSFIKEKFLVDMPDDFYQFWDFCTKLEEKAPPEALKDVGLTLVGPYDVLADRFSNIGDKSPEEYLCHWRYYFDPPEFQSVLKGDDKTGYHIGYFRDSPEEAPVFLASNHAKKDGKIVAMGENIFAATNLFLENLKKTGDPFKKMHIGRIQSALKKKAEELKLSLSEKTEKMISREKKIVTRTFNKIGLVVPYDRKSQQGYRELAMGNKELKTLLTKLENALPEQKSKLLSELQPVLTYASIATDECDFGTGIELGWNIMAHGIDSLDATALRFLASNYMLLNREAFAKIAEAHLSNRRKGCNLSILS